MGHRNRAPHPAPSACSEPKKTIDSTETFYLWDGDRLLAEYDGSGARQVRYAYAGGFAPVQVAYGSSPETIYDVHSDHLDTPRMLTDDARVPSWRASYEAFGKAHVSTDPDGTAVTTDPQITFNIRFPGQYYDASVGRYVSADPIGQLGDLNQFLYAENRPINRIDAFGLISGSGDPGFAVSPYTSVPGPSLPNAAAQAAAANAACAAQNAFLAAVLAKAGLGVGGDLGTAATLGAVGALSAGGAGAAVEGFVAAGGASAVGAWGTAATVGAAGVALATSAYTTALAATTAVNAVNNALGTDFASFSNTGPFREYFPDLTGGGLGPFEPNCECSQQ